MIKRVLLGSSALVGLGMVVSMHLAGPALAQASGGEPRGADVSPGGALDVTISGFVRGLVTAGNTDNFFFDESVSTGLDFLNDTEVHVELEGENDGTGLTYGATVEFEGDTNRTDNTDETWVFLRGGFGELSLGDLDGIADFDGFAVSAATVAVGSDGLENDQIFEEAFGGIRTWEATGTSDATKINYETPSFGGVQLGLGYTPNLDGVNSGSTNGDSIATRDVEAGDVFEGGVKLEQEFGDIGLEASLTGLYGDIKDEDELGGDDYWQAQVGAALELFGVTFAGSYLRQEIGAIEVDAVTAGVGLEVGPVGLSVNYGQIINSDDLTVTSVSDEDLDGDGENDEGDVELDQPWLVIVSATVGLVPGLTLDADVGYFDNDASGDVFSGGDDGYEALGRLGLAF